MATSDSFKVFTVHESVICRTSPFFKAAIAHDWNEAKEKCVPLSQDMPDVFLIYLQWAYWDRVYCTPPLLHGGNYEATSVFQNFLVLAYMLGDKLLDINFQDAVIDILIDFCMRNNQYLIRQAALAFENTPGESPIRTLIIDFATHIRYTPPVGQRLRKDHQFRACLNEEAYIALISKLIGHNDMDQNAQKIARPFEGDTCVYHMHKEGKPCYKVALGLMK